MKFIDDLFLKELPKWHPSREFKRLLVNTDGSLHRVVHGDDIAGQFPLAGLSVVVTDHDYYNGVSYWFYLFTPDGKLLDNVSTPDYVGFMQDVIVQQLSTLEFGFFGTADRWQLAVHTNGFWSFRPRHLIPRMNRFFWRKRYITLRRVRRAQTT